MQIGNLLKGVELGQKLHIHSTTIELKATGDIPRNSTPWEGQSRSVPWPITNHCAGALARTQSLFCSYAPLHQRSAETFASPCLTRRLMYKSDQTYTRKSLTRTSPSLN